MENLPRPEWFYTLPDFPDRAEPSSVRVKIRWRVSRRAKDNVLRRCHILGRNDMAPLAFSLYGDIKTAARGELIFENWTAFLSRYAEKASKSLRKRLIVNKIDIRSISGSGSIVEDLMLICFRFISESDRFFVKFACDETDNLDIWFATLCGYCKKKLEGQLIDEIRTREGSKTFMRSSLGLAARSSEKRVTEALVFYGVTSPQLEEYLLIWRCFKETKDAQLIDTKSPQDEAYQIIADLANQRGVASEQIQMELAINADGVKDCLKKLGEAIRYYLDRPQISIDAPLSSESASPLIDLLPDDSTDPDEELDATDEQVSLNRLSQHIHSCLDEIRQSGKGITKRDWAILLLLRAVELTQSDVAKIADCTQKTISKRNKAIWEKLLSEVIGMSWLPGRAPIEVTSEATEASLKELLSSIIYDYFVALLREEIFSPIARANKSEKSLLLNLIQDCFNLSSRALSPEFERKLEGFIEANEFDTAPPFQSSK